MRTQRRTDMQRLSPSVKHSCERNICSWINYTDQDGSAGTSAGKRLIGMFGMEQQTA